MTITLITASLMALWLIILFFNVVRMRLATKTSLGDGGDAAFNRKIRAHANFIENVPLALLLIGLLEYSRANSFLVLGLGFTLVVARLLHGLGLGFPSLFPSDANLFRLLGSVLTLLVLLVGAVTGLLIAYRVI